jgi:hypothetical protein
VESSPLNAEVAKIKATLRDSLTEQEMNAIDWSKAKPIKNGFNGKGWSFTIASEVQNDLIYAILENGETKFIRHQYSKSNDPSIFTGFSIRSDLSQKNKTVNWYSNNALSKSIQINNGVESVLFENSSSNGRLGIYYIPAAFFTNDFWWVFLPGINNGVMQAVSTISATDNGDPTSGSGEILEFEVDESESEAAKDIEKIFKCFDQIPNGPGTTYQIKLCADLPSNSNPTSPNWLFSAGHAFLVMTKTNGTQSISQPFGFYPQSGFQSLGRDPVNSKIVLDSSHEINASMEIECGYSEFENIRLFGKLWADTKKYDLDEYNCSNFAIDLFNKARAPGDEITVDIFLATFRFPIFVSVPILKSPQALYAKLKSMRESGHPEASKINLDRTHSSKAPAGSGECQ